MPDRGMQDKTSAVGIAAIIFAILGGWLGIALAVAGLLFYYKDDSPVVEKGRKKLQDRGGDIHRMDSSRRIDFPYQPGSDGTVCLNRATNGDFGLRFFTGGDIDNLYGREIKSFLALDL